MGDIFCKPNILTKRIIDYDKLFEIKDFFLLMKVIEHLENKILENEITIFHLCTIVYSQEDMEKLLKEEK